MAAVLRLLWLSLLACLFLVPGDISSEQEATAAPPPSTDCEMGVWTEWSECDPCTRLKYRSRSYIKFAQYGGEKCLGALGEHQRCKPDVKCEDFEIDCGKDFQCDSGRCIKRKLLCNGESDCRDVTDEDDCDDKKQPKAICKKEYELSEIGRAAGSGFNIFGVEIKDTVFDNELFNGVCETVRDVNTKIAYRKPWNVKTLSYQTKADKSFTTETYEDAVSILSEVYKETTLNLDASVTIKTTNDAPASGLNTTKSGAKITGKLGLEGSRNKSIHTIKEYSLKTNKKYLRVSGTIQLGTFNMRPRNVVLTSEFIDDLNDLPSSYHKFEYFAFLEMYGTHYTTAGKIGGKYELVYVLDSALMKKRDVTIENVLECLGFNARIEVEGQGVNVSAKINPEACRKTGSRNVPENKTVTPVVDDTISFVEGGTLKFATILDEKISKKKGDVNSEDFVDWATSLIDAPSITEKRLSPIYTLVPVDIRDAYIKTKNLERAMEDYLDEYNVCKCQPCQNGGTVLLVDGVCMCQCPLQYKGLACQEVKDKLLEKPTVPVDGRWSCWKTSSSCINGEETRTRTCNNPEPQEGGKPCAGKTTKKVPCQEKARHYASGVFQSLDPEVEHFNITYYKAIDESEDSTQE
ncbi:complement component C9-like [Engystomops pustulosus]|uniref:complement component C9-like n=1 Tax=Engystomops pustulosus TaxID=76066 RepID=UPI003AFAC00C